MREDPGVMFGKVVLNNALNLKKNQYQFKDSPFWNISSILYLSKMKHKLKEKEKLNFPLTRSHLNQLEHFALNRRSPSQPTVVYHNKLGEWEKAVIFWFSLVCCRRRGGADFRHDVKPIFSHTLSILVCEITRNINLLCGGICEICAGRIFHYVKYTTLHWVMDVSYGAHSSW